MERVELLKLGAFCLQRMSLKAQKELLFLAENGNTFSKPILSELKEIEKGNDFIKACGGVFDLSGFMDILTYCDQPTVDRIITEEKYKNTFLRSPEINGSFVLENGASYYSPDLESTLKWFERVLGWSGIIEARDETGKGVYGLIIPHIKANSPGNRKPYMQLIKGTPLKLLPGFTVVWGISSLRQHAIDSGWNNLTPIEKQPWGANAVSITTCDGSLLQFCEPVGFR
jgi:hypothetical protein